MKGIEILCQKVFLLIYIVRMNIKTNLLEDYVNFVDTTTRQITYLKIINFLSAMTTSLYLFYLLYKYLNEKHFFFRTNI